MGVVFIIFLFIARGYSYAEEEEDDEHAVN
jgi:hypothetical protein